MAPETDSASESESESARASEELGASFRQSRKEMWVMLCAWAVFFLFVTAICGSMGAAKSADGTVPTLFGMPRWVAIGIAFPWLAANVLTYWFSFHFMRDTHLGDEE